MLEVSGSSEFKGILLAHEVGHYAGLGTGPAATSVMGVDPNEESDIGDRSKINYQNCGLARTQIKPSAFEMTKSFKEPVTHRQYHGCAMPIGRRKFALIPGRVIKEIAHCL